MRPTTETRAGKVDVDSAPPFRVRNLINRLTELVLATASVVDQHINPAKFTNRSCHHFVDLLRYGDVGRLDQASAPKFAHALSRFFQLRERARGCDHICPGASQSQGHGAAEAAA